MTLRELRIAVFYGREDQFQQLCCYLFGKVLMSQTLA